MRGDRPPSLAELQDAFQRALVNGDDGILAHIPPNALTGADVLLGVYRNAYVARLVDIILSDYERLARYVGPDTLAGWARAYVAAHPSRFPNARYVSHRLPEFLEGTPAGRAHPEVAELARFERTLADAFDAPDEPAMSVERLAAEHPPDAWGALVFTPVRSAVRLDHRTNTYAIWSALKETDADAGARPAVVVCSPPQRLLVWRQDLTPLVRVLGEEEALLWDAGASGSDFAALCELAAQCGDPETAALRAAQYLQGWLAGGVLAGARLTQPASTEA